MTVPALSVCINHKNRSFYEMAGSFVPLFRKSFDYLMHALAELDLPVEVVIADWPDERSVRLGLGSWVEHPRVKVVPCCGVFTRGEGRQIAAREASGDALYFMDANMLTPVALLSRGLQVVADGKAFFPLYVRQSRFRSAQYVDGIGTGNCIVSREMHKRSSGYPAKQTWGGEDTKYWRWYVDRDLSVREKVPGFIHQWHPGDNHNA